MRKFNFANVHPAIVILSVLMCIGLFFPVTGALMCVVVSLAR